MRRSAHATGAQADRGQATVEFALLVPLIALCVIGLVQVARITALQVATVEAARAGARAAAVDPHPTAARTAALGSAPGVHPAVDTTFTNGAPRFVTVRVTTSVSAVPLLGWSTVHLDATSTMLVEPSG